MTKRIGTTFGWQVFVTRSPFGQNRFASIPKKLKSYAIEAMCGYWLKDGDCWGWALWLQNRMVTTTLVIFAHFFFASSWPILKVMQSPSCTS